MPSKDWIETAKKVSRWIVERHHISWNTYLSLEDVIYKRDRSYNLPNWMNYMSRRGLTAQEIVDLAMARFADGVCSPDGITLSGKNIHNVN